MVCSKYAVKTYDYICTIHNMKKGLGGMDFVIGVKPEWGWN